MKSSPLSSIVPGADAKADQPALLEVKGVHAAYVKKTAVVVLSGLTASATTEFFEVALGGLITLTAAVAFLGVDLTSGSTNSSFSLGFKTLPIVFGQMPGGRFFGALWFFMLWLAAITSSLSMLQPAQAFIEEALGCSRRTATALVASVAVAGSLYCLWFTGGTVGWGTIDDWVGTFLIVVLAFFQVVAFGWRFGVKRGLDEAHEGAQLRIPAFMSFILKFVAPAYLLTSIVLFAKDNLGAWWGKAFVPGHKVADGNVDYQPVGGYSLILLAGLPRGLLLLNTIGTER